MEVIFSKTPTPLAIPVKLHTLIFFKFLGVIEPLNPNPREIPNLSVGEYGYFLDIF